MKVIVAVDQTAYWKQVVEAVLKRHWPEGTAFKILTVLEPMPWQELETAMWSSTEQDLARKRHDQAEEILRQARNALDESLNECSVHTELRRGSARSEIIDAAVEWMADRIVLGAHGNSPNRLFPAILSHSVAERSHCSLELIRIKPIKSTSKTGDTEKHKTGASV